MTYSEPLYDWASHGQIGRRKDGLGGEVDSVRGRLDMFLSAIDAYADDETAPDLAAKDFSVDNNPVSDEQLHGLLEDPDLDASELTATAEYENGEVATISFTYDGVQARPHNISLYATTDLRNKIASEGIHCWPRPRSVPSLAANSVKTYIQELTGHYQKTR